MKSMYINEFTHCGMCNAMMMPRSDDSLFGFDRMHVWHEVKMDVDFSISFRRDNSVKKFCRKMRTVRSGPG